MKDNTELEEGEACYNKDDDEGTIDLDSLSYIDERIQHVLGHFQKDFEGGVSAENLGAKFGGYGSFLPTHERSPRLLSHPKTPQRNHSPPKSPINLCMEAGSHNTKAPPNMSHSARLGTASHSSHSFDNLRVPAVDDSVKKDRQMSSSEVAEKSTFKDGIAKKSGNSTDQRTLKFRIKMKSNTIAKKNAEIYSGLGLDNSPSSSMGNSPMDSEGKPPVSQENAEDSPSAIIQVMTSFPIPGGVLTSPLHESLLCLQKKGKVIGESRYTPSLNGHQQPSSMSTDESDSFAGDGRLKKRKVRIVRQSKKQFELKHINGALPENDMTSHTKKKLGNKTPDRKDFLSNDMKCTPLSSSICDAVETAEVTGKAYEVSKEVNKDGMPGKKVSVDVMKEESLDSISVQDFEKTEKQNSGNGYMKLASEHKLENSDKNNFTEHKNNDKHYACMISKKVECGAVKAKADQDSQNCENNQNIKAASEGNDKSKVDQSPGKAVAVAREDSSGGANNTMVTDKKSASFGVSSCKSKNKKPKSLKEHMVRDSSRYPSKGKKSELKVDGPSGNSSIKNVNIDNFEKYSALGAKVKERPSGNNVVNQLLDEPTFKDASGSFPITENKPASEVIPSTVVAPQLIEEDWVCCDNCQKWRLLPTGMKPEQLPERWLCSMLNWLPGMNRCDISEDETTKALHTLLYQMPISAGQNNMQMLATGTAIGGSSNDPLHFGLNHNKSSSDVLSGRGKKKYVIKERTMEGINTGMLQSNSVKINGQESGKNSRLTGRNQPHADSNLMKKTSSKHVSRLNNLIQDEHVAKEKEKQIKKGDAKHIKLKRKMDVDQCRTGTPKKSKTEDVCYVDKQLKQLNPGMDLEKVGLNSRYGLPTKTTGKDMRKYDDYCSSADVEDKSLVHMKKGDQAEVSADGWSLDVKNRSKLDGSWKRKLKDQVDNEKHRKSFSFQDDEQYGREGNASGFRKEGKYGISNTAGDDKLNEDRMRQADIQVDVALQPKKHRKSIASDQLLLGIKPLGMDKGSEQHSLAATSSSSKVSGSHKARTNREDVIGSPVESVTSSPLRTTNLNMRVLAVGDVSRKDDAAKGGPFSIGSRTNVDHREGRLSVKMKDDRFSHSSNPSSHKFLPIQYQIEGAKDKARVQDKTSAEVLNDHLLEVGVPDEQHDNVADGMRREEKIKNKLEGDRHLQKSGKVTSFHNKKKERRSGSQVDTDTVKVSAFDNGYTKSGGRYDSAVDPSYLVSGPETRNDAKYSSPKFKCEMDNVTEKHAQRYGSSETGKQNELKLKYLENSILKIDAQNSSDSKTISQQNLTQDYEENNANHACTDSGDGKFKIISTDVGEVKRETSYGGSKTAPGYQKRDMSHEHPVHVSGNGDVAKLMRKSVDGSSNAGVSHSSGVFHPHQRLYVSSPVRINSSQTAAFNTLEEATKLKDMADHFKNSGFEFESNESYFNAALKFLHGASLLENGHSESSKHGEMNPMQVYATAAKLFKSCAYEYERREEMAAAALTYKCMEVAYMRVVNCKNSVTNRDRHELQSNLQMVSQGESPSSSASDVDNLNNQAALDKSTLLRATNSHVASNQILTARTQPNLVRLLDFIQDTNFAIEASKKCQSTFAAANVNMEEARNRDCIVSIRRVIDFSFQDVDELVRLVWVANKSISGAGLGGARD